MWFKETVMLTMGYIQWDVLGIIEIIFQPGLHLSLIALEAQHAQTYEVGFDSQSDTDPSELFSQNLSLTWKDGMQLSYPCHWGVIVLYSCISLTRSEGRTCRRSLGWICCNQDLAVSLIVSPVETERQIGTMQLHKPSSTMRKPLMLYEVAIMKSLQSVDS